MQMRERFLVKPALISTVLVSILLGASSATTSAKVLHSFAGGRDGSNPAAGLIFDGAGNLYGTTQNGGLQQAGTVFELTPNSDGTWTESELYSFKGSPDGAAPRCDLILFAGNLYGTTLAGGINNVNEGGDGTAFELTPVSGGGWTETIIHSFGSGTDGMFPEAGLVADATGNLFGTTAQGGAHGLGAIFELTPVSGGWMENVIYSFAGGKSGAGPTAGLSLDTSGNVYGTTSGGGTRGLGNIFKLTHGANGKWTESVIHTFTGGRWGANPYGGLVFDVMGNLYGTTAVGGVHNWGIAFKLVLNSDGKWIESVLHSFGGGRDGRNPYAALIFDKSGNLYGTTALGGESGTGAIFKLAHSGDKWTESVIYGFPGSRLNGEQPMAGVILDGADNLYGMTPKGGAHGKGVAYELTP
jgi:uncharacterized repeat protein (TIGR03803 family)